jgi:uncharacterized protein
MHFEHRAVLAATPEQVWDFMMDVPRVSACVPGVEDVAPVGGDTDAYSGTLRVRVGPVALALQGTIRIVEKDAAAGRAVMKAEAADKKIGGRVDAQLGMQLAGQGDQATELFITTDANVLGKIGEFGQPVIKKKAEQMMREFAENVKKQVGH